MSICLIVISIKQRLLTGFLLTFVRMRKGPRKNLLRFCVDRDKSTNQIFKIILTFIDRTFISEFSLVLMGFLMDLGGSAT